LYSRPAQLSRRFLASISNLALVLSESQPISGAFLS
jgi:hypothetical protein